MTQKTVTSTDCEIKMNNLENVIKKYFWIAVITLVGILGSSFTFYYQQQEKKINANHEQQTLKINAHAVASIKSDERLEERLKTQDVRHREEMRRHSDRQIQVEKNQAAMAAKLDIHMANISATCARIEKNQRQDRTP